MTEAERKEWKPERRSLFEGWYELDFSPDISRDRLLHDSFVVASIEITK